MDVLLVIPVRAENYYIVPTLGLGYIATAIRSVGHTVELLDTPRLGLDLASFEKEIARFKPRIIGIQFLSSDYHSMAEMLPVIRRVHPSSVIVLGGPHPTSDPEQVLKDFPLADYAFRGEAEKGIALLVPHLLDSKVVALDSIPGLIFKNEEKILVNAQDHEVDLDKFGFPAWDLLNPGAYGSAPQAAFFRRFPYAPISTARGCPYRCSYCSVPRVSGNRLRKHSVQHVVEEIRLLRTKYGVREIHIIDDAFTSDRARTIEFCNLLIREKLDVGFTFPNGVRLDTLDRELLLKMKEAGLEFFSVGIESGSDRILKDMRKGLTTALIEEKIKLIHELGLVVNAFFIIGYPEDTRETIEETISFAKRLPLQRAQFSLFKAYPGTEISERLLARGQIKEINYAAFSFHKVDVVPAGMTFQELKRYQRRAFSEFYFRPRVLWGVLCEIRSFQHLKIILQRLFVSLFVSK